MAPFVQRLGFEILPTGGRMTLWIVFTPLSSSAQAEDPCDARALKGGNRVLDSRLRGSDDLFCCSVIATSPVSFSA